MKKKWLAVGIILLFVGVTIAPAIAQNIEKSQSISRGNWLYVGGNGPGNYSTIQSAINYANDGDTIFVYDDSSPYTESLSINKKITLFGEDKMTTVINSPGYQGDVITIRTNNISVHNFTLTYEDACGIRILADYATVTNLYVNGSGGYGTGITFENAHNALISNIILERTQFGITNRWYDDSTSHIIIEHCCIQYCINRGIYMESSDDNIFQDNTIIHDGYGIMLIESSNNQLLNNTISVYNLIGILIDGINNTIIGNTLINSSFKIDTLYGNVFSNNTVNDNPFIYYVDVVDQTIDNAGQVFLVNCSNITLKNIEIGFCLSGIYLYETTDSIIQNCTIFNCDEGITLMYASDNFISSSLIIDCGCGINLFHGPHNTFYNNSLSGCGMLLASGNNLVYYNKLYDSSITLGPGDNNIIEQNIINNIYLKKANFCVITKNNFINKFKPAKFSDGIRNNWTNNYWGRPMNHPKIIFGHRFLFSFSPLFPPGLTVAVNIPWINFDWHPAQEPYNIPGMI